MSNYLSPDDINNMINSNRLIVFNGNKIYDITDLLDNHPGGNNCLIERCLKDCYKDFNFHSNLAKKHWKKYLIGSRVKLSLFDKLLYFLD
jgi:cytochrome b involved in lipid metabolism